MDFNLLTTKNIRLLEQIDWFSICHILSQNAYFSETKSRINNLLQFQSQTEAKSALNDLESYLDDFENHKSILEISLLNVDPEYEFFNITKKISASETLDAQELYLTGKIFNAYFKCSQQLPFPLHSSEFSIFPDKNSPLWKNYLKEINLLFDNQGNISYTQHPALKGLYFTSQKIESEIRQKILTLIQDKKFSKILQFNQYDIINDKFILPIRSDHYRYQQGTIISKSKTGLTLFVEPFSIKDLNSKRLEMLALLDSEVYKISKYLTELLKNHEQEVKACFSRILWLDIINTRALFTRKNQLTKPIFINTQNIKIQALFHPLITNPISNNFNIKIDECGFIMSGPNTGGKSIFLKSLCLCFLLPYAGLYVPAKSAELYLPDALYYFSNDFQSLNEGLSSFSSESIHYLSAYKELKKKPILFIDEIFNSTGSEEASLLAVSIFNQILKKTKAKAKIFLSTHHQLLKIILFQNKSFLSAHMEFNPETGFPTYKIQMGSPGSSHAIDVFQNLEKQVLGTITISNDAYKQSKKQSITYEKALRETLHQKELFQKKINEYEKYILDIEKKEQSLNDHYNFEKDKFKKKFKRKIEELIIKAEKLIDQLQKKEITSKKEGYQLIDSLKKDFSQTIPSPRKNQTQKTNLLPVRIDEITEGQRYYSPIFGGTVKILSLNPRKQIAQAKGKSMKAWIPYNQLFPLEKNQYKQPNSTNSAHIQQEIHGSLELDCRGMRLEQFQKEVEPRIYEVLNGSIPFITIIHGHGHGILKDWLRSYLKKFEDLNWQNIEGNDGCTRVTLKDQ